MTSAHSLEVLAVERRRGRLILRHTSTTVYRKVSPSHETSQSGSNVREHSKMLYHTCYSGYAYVTQTKISNLLTSHEMYPQ
jgi:hypothetical protein